MQNASNDSTEPLNRPTVPDRIAQLMGDDVWDAGRLECKMREVGSDIQSSNLRAYISGIFCSALITVCDKDGLAIVNERGQPLRAHKFTRVDRGLFRVSTTEDVKRELGETLSHVEISDIPPPAPIEDAKRYQTPPKKHWRNNFRVSARLHTAPPSPVNQQHPLPEKAPTVTMDDARREVVRLASKYELEQFPGILTQLAEDLHELAAKLGSRS